MCTSLESLQITFIYMTGLLILSFLKNHGYHYSHFMSEVPGLPAFEQGI